MALPIAELIARDLVDALKQIRKTSGYLTTVASVERRNTPTNIIGDWRCVVEMGDPLREDGKTTYPVEAYRLPFDIYIWVNITEDPAVAIETAITSAWADAVRALMVDQTRGDNAFMTVCNPPIFFDDGLLLNVDVVTRWNSFDPTTKAPS